MSEKFENRIRLIADWVSKEDHQSDALPKSEVYLHYFLALLEVVGADGKITNKERDWIVGYATATGAPQEVINQIQAYQISPSREATEIFQCQKGTVYAEYIQLLIYDGYRAAGADGELHPKEVEAINNLARSLSVSEEKLRQILSLFEEEDIFHHKRNEFLFPANIQQKKLN